MNSGFLRGDIIRIRIRNPLMSRRRRNLFVTAASECYKNRAAATHAPPSYIIYYDVDISASSDPFIESDHREVSSVHVDLLVTVSIY